MEKSNINRSLLEPENIDSSSSFNKLSTGDTDHDKHNQLLLDDLHASSKDDSIKYVIALQEQHLTKLVQMDKIHSKATKELEMQLIQEQQNAIDGENS